LLTGYKLSADENIFSQRSDELWRWFGFWWQACRVMYGLEMMAKKRQMSMMPLVFSSLV